MFILYTYVLKICCIDHYQNSKCIYVCTYSADQKLTLYTFDKNVMIQFDYIFFRNLALVLHLGIVKKYWFCGNVVYIEVGTTPEHSLACSTKSTSCRSWTQMGRLRSFLIGDMVSPMIQTSTTRTENLHRTACACFLSMVNTIHGRTNHVNNSLGVSVPSTSINENKPNKYSKQSFLFLFLN